MYEDFAKERRDRCLNEIMHLDMLLVDGIP